MALQQLTDASEHRGRFRIIAKIGVDGKQLRILMKQQMLVWFGLPVFTAILGSGAALCYILKVSYRSYIPYITEGQTAACVLFTYLIFLLVVTYILFKRNVLKSSLPK